MSLLWNLLFAGLVAGRSFHVPEEIKNLVVFGDSYTDEGRLSYFINNNGTAPPAGYEIPASNFTASGGYTWPHFASQILGAKTYNYAVSGAVCSNELISRYLESIDAPFPSVIDYEIPAFQADLKASVGNTTLFEGRDAANTVYALWIGTNDLGVNAFLTDSQLRGSTISDFLDCIWSVFDGIYSTGGRRFVILNEAPLNVSPLYAAPENGGVGDNQYWTNKTAYNMTEIEQKMLEYTTNVNTMFAYGVPFQLLVQQRWPEADFTIFDVHKLLLDVHVSPSRYLDAPANVTGFYHQCGDPNSEYSDCIDSSDSLGSFLWYDELHPSSKTDEIIGSEFVKLLSGNSSYGISYKS
ncbi:carbohydrate esterase family 16 protein [Xylariaceae sp. FL0016]|nr:carbohydrate esterase family 16 protein [Xylariaceae sp. FL0016]